MLDIALWDIEFLIRTSALRTQVKFLLNNIKIKKSASLRVCVRVFTYMWYAQTLNKKQTKPILLIKEIIYGSKSVFIDKHF